MKLHLDVTGLILAGGRSQRFGENKALAEYQGVSFIERTYRTLKILLPKIFVITNQPEDYHHLPFPLVRDEIPHQGPLSGLATGLKCISTPYALVVACDMPLLNHEILEQVLEQGRDHQACIPQRSGQSEFLLARYAKDLLPQLQEALASGMRSFKEWHPTLSDVVSFEMRGLAAYNVNTRQDLKRLEGQNAARSL